MNKKLFEELSYLIEKEDNMKKICKRCGSEKDINEFRLMKGDKKNYYLGICKKCESDKQREYFKDAEKSRFWGNQLFLSDINLLVNEKDDVDFDKYFSY